MIARLGLILIEYKEISGRSKATQQDVEEFVSDVKEAAGEGKTRV